MTSTARRVRQAVWTQEPTPEVWWAWCPCATPPPVPDDGLDLVELTRSWLERRRYCEKNSLGFWKPRGDLVGATRVVTEDLQEGWVSRLSGGRRLVLPSGYDSRPSDYPLPGRPRPLPWYGPAKQRPLPPGARVWTEAESPGRVYRHRKTVESRVARLPAVVECPLCRAPVLVERPDDGRP